MFIIVIFIYCVILFILLYINRSNTKIITTINYKIKNKLNNKSSLDYKESC